MEQFFNKYAEMGVGITLQDFLSLSRVNPLDLTEPFYMAYLAM